MKSCQSPDLAVLSPAQGLPPQGGAERQFAQVSQVTRSWGGGSMGGTAALTGLHTALLLVLPCTKLAQKFFFFFF